MPTTTPKHPLIGKILRWDSDDGESFQISRFVEDLGGGYFLMERLCPQHRHTQATTLGVKHVRSIDQLTLEEGADIFDSWDVFMKSWRYDESDESEETETKQLSSHLH